MKNNEKELLTTEMKREKYDKKVQHMLEEGKERWRIIQIQNRMTQYMVSNLGRVYNKEKERYLKIGKPMSGKYIRVTLHTEFGRYDFSLHRLVATYFCKIPKRHEKKGLSYDDLIPNHKNGIKDCNAAFNLEWVSYKEFMDPNYKEKFGIGSYGENSHLAKIDRKTVVKICEYIMQKRTNKEIAILLDDKVSEKTIQHIRSRESWKEVSAQYDFPKLSLTVPYMYDEFTIHEICRDIREGKYTDKEIAKMNGTTKEYVRDIRNHKRRRDISIIYGI